MLGAGTQIGPYQIINQLGAGGMGEVYRARDPRLDREVAIKVLPADLAQSSERLARFEREAKALAALAHPNILDIHDYGTAQGVSFVVMELLQGETLRQRVVAGALPWRKALEIGVAIADGLAAAHDKGIVHRDLKPENIFLTADGRVKILDFGLARMETPTPPEAETISYVPAPTEPGTVMGTAAYMSPEQVRGQAIDGRSDIFSFGCVLYEMVTRKRPFARHTSAETMAAILHDEPPALKAAAVEPVIRHCLKKKPENRPQSAHDLAHDLRAILTDASRSRFSTRVWGRPFAPALWRVAAVMLVVILGGALLFPLLRGWWNRTTPDQPWEAGEAIDSLAVMPFANESEEPGREFLSDTVTESIIDNLSRLRKTHLRVMSFTAVSRYKGRAADVQTVGRDLRVRRVLTGRVRQHRGDLTINVELVDAQDKSRIWGQSYQKKPADLLAVHEEIAKDVARELGLQLSKEEQKRLTQRPTANREAFQLYRMGRFHWNKRTTEGFQKGIDYFERARREDPNYALAYAGLADCYTLLGIESGLRPKEAFPRAKAEAEKALRLDPTLAAPHTSLAFAAYVFDWDWTAAESGFKRAIELDPSYLTAHHWYADYLTARGRHKEALARIKQALELEPLSLIINRDVGWNQYFAGQYDQAIDQLQKTLEMDPNFVPALSLIARVFEQKGRYTEAIAALEKANRLSPDKTAYKDMLGHTYGVSGQRAEAQKVLRELTEPSRQSYVSPYFLARIYAGLGDEDQVFSCLRKAAEERDPSIVYLKVDPSFDDRVRSDPRFDDMLKRIGLR